MNQLRYSIFLLLLPFTLTAQTVSNVTVQQKGDKIEVSYTLDKEADTYMTANIDGKNIFCTSVTGDMGENMSAGRHTATWEVLADIDNFVGNAYFEVNASASTRTKLAEKAAQQREQKRAARLDGIYPLAGLDVNAGFYGAGCSIYWPWVTNRPSRVGSYISYIYGGKDWSNSDIAKFHNICLGGTFTLSKHVAFFVAPGLSIVKYQDEDLYEDDYDKEYKYDRDAEDILSSIFNRSSSSSYSDTNNQYRLVIEGGVSFKLLLFTISVKYAYPSYVGFGLGLDFGWLH